MGGTPMPHKTKKMADSDVILIFPTADGEPAPRPVAMAPAPSEPLRISVAEAAGAEEDRFHRFRLISWWDQAKLANAKVLVVGAGALGNEIVKNLALLGVGNLLIADLDKIENSNLSRSVLYRASDNGTHKA